MRFVTTLAVLAATVGLLASGAAAQRPSLAAVNSDWNTNDTWVPAGNDGVPPETFYWSGTGTPWQPAYYDAYCPTDPVAGNDSSKDGLNDRGLMADNAGWFTTRLGTGTANVGSNFGSDFVAEVAYQIDPASATMKGYIGRQPIASRSEVVEFRAGVFTSTSGGVMPWIWIQEDPNNPGTQMITVLPVDMGGQGAEPDLRYYFVNSHVPIDLEDKDGDGKIVECSTANYGTTFNPDPDRDAGIVLATGLSMDIVEIKVEVDPFTTYTAVETADFISSHDGLETVTMNYAKIKYTIDDCDGVADAITGEFGAGVGYFLQASHPAPYFTTAEDAIFDYAYLNLLAPKGDANGDGVVNDADLSLLLTGWGGAGTWASGDFNEDGVKNDADLSLMLSKWALAVWTGVRGDPIPDHFSYIRVSDPMMVAVDPVPEPATLALLGLGALALVRRRR